MIYIEKTKKGGIGMIINIIGYILLAYFAFLALGIIAKVIEIFFIIFVGIFKYIRLLWEILWDTRTFLVPVIMGIWFYTKKGNIIWNANLFQDRIFIIYLVISVFSIIAMWFLPKLILSKWDWLNKKVYVMQMRQLSKQIDIPEEWRREDAQNGLYY